MIEYDPHRWRTTFLAVRGSMLGVIAFRTSVVTGVSLVLNAIHVWLMPIALGDVSIHGLVTPALALLLVFRTNASYDRWWEGRKLWGAIVNTCRNLSRTVIAQLPNDTHRVERLLKLVKAFPSATMKGLRGQAWMTDALDGRDQPACEGAQHPPTAIAIRITQLLREAREGGQLSDIVMTAIDTSTTQLIDCVGACERIHKTPLPFAYAVHLRRALVLYCATLPFVLLGRFGWATSVIVFVVSYILFGIEEIGVEIEDPFDGDDNDLPLEVITANIEKNVEALMVSQQKTGG